MGGASLGRPLSSFYDGRDYKLPDTRSVHKEGTETIIIDGPGPAPKVGSASTDALPLGTVLPPVSLRTRNYCNPVKGTTTPKSFKHVRNFTYKLIGDRIAVFKQEFKVPEKTTVRPVGLTDNLGKLFHSPWGEIETTFSLRIPMK